MQLMQVVKDRLSMFMRMYDSIRVIDPISKQVIREDGEVIPLNLNATGYRCEDFWGQNSVCRNCVSFRAYKNKKSLFKIERIDEEAYCIFSLPIELEGRVYVVELLKKVTQDDFFSDLSSSLSIPLDSTTKTLTEMATIDSLTGAYNRRYLEERLAKELMYCDFYQLNLAVLLIDIDYFKQINDCYGHLGGDEILKQFVSVIQSVLRQGVDWVSRYGGEEFVVVLKNVDLIKAREVAERIRYSIEDHIFNIHEGKNRLTCSIGGSMYKLGQDTQRELLFDADQKLYKAKNNGRNQVVF